MQTTNNNNANNTTIKHKRPRIINTARKGELVYSSGIKYNLQKAYAKIEVVYNYVNYKKIDIRVVIR